MNALETRKLTKKFGDSFAVEGLDLTVPEGCLFGFLGPNGAGKTTTIRMALGLIRPTGGEVAILGSAVYDGGHYDLRPLNRVGVMVEEPAFWDGLSARRNLELFARAAGPADDRRRRLERVEECLELVDLGGAGSKKVKAFSHGMRQRLGIARAMLGKPDLLILDEPTNGLDPQGIKEVRELMRHLAGEGITVFLSSHLLAEVEAVCDEVAVLGRGRLLAQGPPQTIGGRGVRLRVVVDNEALATDLLTRFGGVSVEVSSSTDALSELVLSTSGGRIDAAEVNAALVAGGVRVSALTPSSSTLEEAFLDLTEGADVPS